MPIPEAQARTALVSIEPASGIVGTTIESVISIVVTGAGTVVVYDQWEDGYEVDLNNPVQSTTQIWGDGNDANGKPPGYANDPASFAAGAVIVLRNQIPLPRNPSNLFYDGRDRFGGTKALVVSRASWATTPGTVLCGANEVMATMDYGTSYIAPVGDDVSANSMFEYVGMWVMARDDGTSVTIDADGPGAGAAITITLNRGESYLVNGGIKKGATVTSTKPVQADLITGDIGARYESRRFTLYPTDQWSAATYAPLGTASNGDTAYAFLYNPKASSINIAALTSTGTSTFTVPAKSVYQYTLPKDSGTRFSCATDDPFFGVVTVGANPTANNVHDWGFSLLPSDTLTTEAVVGWGPGSSDGTQNGSPVWVTPIATTRIYVDYNGDRLGSLTDPKGNKYDVHYDVTALNTKIVYDPDKDQTAMRLYTLDGVQIAAAWGQDPAVAGAGNPFLDCGTTVLPFPVPVLRKTVTIAQDNNTAGLSVGDVLQYSITVDNHGLLPLGNLLVLDPLNLSLTYVAGSTYRDGTNIPDNGTGTAFPLDESGYNVPIILRSGSTTFTYKATISGTGTITNSASNPAYQLIVTNNVVVPVGSSTPCTIKFTNSTGTIVTSYSVGAGIYATLTDPDSNQSSSTIETQIATVTDVATGDSETITLTETGANTGIFRNTSPLPSSATLGATTQDGTFYTAAGHTITVTHLDTVYGETCSDTAVIAVPTQNKFLYLTDPGQALDRVNPATDSGVTVSSSALASGSQTVTTGTTTTGSNSNVASGGTLSFAHTPGGTGSNQLLLVSIAVGGTTSGGAAGTISGVTFGALNTAMTLVNTVTSNAIKVYIYRLNNPQTAAGNVVVTVGTNASSVAAAATTFNNVDLTASLGSVTNFNAGSVTAGNVAVTSAVGDLVYAIGAWDEGGTNESIAAVAGQTSLFNNSGFDFVSASVTTKPGAAGSVTSSWTAGDAQEFGAIGLSIKPAPLTGSTTTTFTQSPTFASTFTLPVGSAPTVQAYFSMNTGSMPASPNVTATLKKGATPIASSSSAAAAGGLLTFTFPALGSAASYASGDAMSLVFTTAESGISFNIDYNSVAKLSKITLPTTTVISVNSVDVYDAPYPGGSLITSPTSGSTAYVRSTASDPFGAQDITSMGLSIDGPGVTGDITTTLSAGQVVNTTTGTKTYEYAWTIGATTGAYNIVVTANEGSEGINATSATTVNVSERDLGTPSTTEFTTGYNGVHTHTYTGGETVYVRVTDLDENTNPAVAETIVVIITSQSGDSELRTLTETGPNTGVFAGNVPASTSGGVGNNNGTLHAILGDVLNVVYFDDDDSSDTSSDYASVPSGAASVSVKKTLVAPTDGVAIVGEALQYTVQVTNNGNSTLNTISLTDTFPAAKLAFVSASTTPNTIGSGSLVWTNVGPLNQGQSITYTLNFTALASGNPVANTALADAGGGVTGTSTANVIITNPKLTVVKTLVSPNPGPANIGDNVTFHIAVTNSGDTSIPTIPLEDTFSGADFEYVSATLAPDASGSGSILWLDITTTGSLAPAGVIGFDVVMKAKGAAAPATNSAAVNYATDINGDSVPPAIGSKTITLLAAKITGHVYFEDSLTVNSTFDGLDSGFNDVTVKLYTDPNNDGSPADGTLVAIVTTGTSGDYEFGNLPIAHYVIVESQPQGYASSGDTQGANDNRIALDVPTLTTFSGNNFFDYLPAPGSYGSIAGKVWNDLNSSATSDVGDTAIANISVDLIEDTNNNGIADPGEAMVASALTATDGTYSFTTLSPGNYVVVEHDLFGWTSTADASPPNNNMIPVTLTPGASITGRDFLDVVTGTISGKVFRDVNGTGGFDAGDVALNNIPVLITSSIGVQQTVYTNASGNWTATVPPGTTTVDVQQGDAAFTAIFSSGYIQSFGTDPNTVTAVSSVNTAAGDDGFRQVGTVSGHLYIDTNGNGTQNGAETGLGGIDVRITDSAGLHIVSTDSNGNWSLAVLPGSILVDVDDSDPQFPAGVVHIEGTDPITVTVLINQNTSAGNNGYYIPATVNGHLYVDTNGNGTQDGVEPNLPNVDVVVTDSANAPHTVTTDSAGNWTIQVPPGTTIANVDETDPQFTALVITAAHQVYQQTQGNDPTTITAIAGVVPNNGGTDGYYNPPFIYGHVYKDTNGNNTQDVGEPNLANVNVVTIDALNVTRTVATNATGDWQTAVAPGTASVNVDETDPDFITEVGSSFAHTEGTDPNNVVAVTASAVNAGIDGYVSLGTVHGHLYVDTNGNGIQDGVEPNMPNVDVVITDRNNVAQTVATNSTGDWTASVPPGTTTANVVETDPQFTALVITAAHQAYQQTQGNDPTTFTAVANSSIDGGTDGYYNPPFIFGHAYVDTNGNGVQNGAEPNLSFVNVVITDANSVTQTVVTDSNGNWQAQVAPGTATVNISETDPDFITLVPGSYLHTEGTDPSTVLAVIAIAVDAGNDGYFRPATVHGHVYLDTNGNNIQDGTEVGIPNIDVQVKDSNNVNHIAVTDSNGNWTIQVPAGTTVIDVQESDPQFPALAVHKEGTDPNTVTAIVDQDIDGGTDGYYVPASLTGHLYVDSNGNGTQDGVEPNLANVDVKITDVLNVVRTVSTDSSGNWSVAVPPGSATVKVDTSDPQFTGVVITGPHQIYQQTEGTDPNSVIAVAGTSTNGGTDGYYNPPFIYGHIYKDTNGNNTQDSGEPDLAFVNVVTIDSLSVTRIVSTDSSGNWQTPVAPGTATVNVDETDSDFVTQVPGSFAHTEGTDPNSVLAVGASAVNAGIDGYVSLGTVHGHLYVDTNGNGVQDGVEPNLAAVDVVITDRNNVAQTVATDSNGDWTALVPPGTTTANVVETDPQFTSLVITATHQIYQQTQGNDPTTFTAIANSSVDGGTDGYYNPPFIFGHVYKDTNGNGTQDSGEPDLAFVNVVVKDANNVTQTVVTNSAGVWQAAVAPGTATINVDETDSDFIALIPTGYSVTEGTDPDSALAVVATAVDAGNTGYATTGTLHGHVYRDVNGNNIQDGTEPNLANIDVKVKDSANADHIAVTDSDGNWSLLVIGGSTVVDVDETDTDFPSGAIHKEGTDPQTITVLPGQSVDAGNDGYFIPATVSGHIYVDTNGNGVQGVTEPNLVGVDVKVTDSANVIRTVTTDSNGNWTIDVPPGNTSANVDETDLQFTALVITAAHQAYTQTQGNDPTVINALAGVANDGGTDGYYNPPFVYGRAYFDTNGNGVQNGTEPNLANVNVVITDALNVIRTVVTDSSGNWQSIVAPGTATVNIDETDPDFLSVVTGSYVATEGTDPSTVLGTIGTATFAGNDGYFVPSTVNGHVYIDTNGNGTQDGTEPNLPNIDVIIKDSNNVNHTVVTDANGNWTVKVPAGATNIDVQESDPDFPANAIHREGADPNTIFVSFNSTDNGGTDGYFIPATVNGHLYVDTDGNGVQHVTEPNLANVDVKVTDSLGVIRTVTTDSNGNWTVQVPPGSTSANVDETDPQFTALVITAAHQAYTQTQGNDPTVINALAGISNDGGTDGYYNPPFIYGHAYRDTNGNGTQNAGEPNLAFVNVVITDALNVIRTVVTDSSGNWQSAVAPGTATVNITETDPDFITLLPGLFIVTEGADPSTVLASIGTATSAGNDGYFAPATVHGHVYIDTNGNNTQDATEPNLANIDVIIKDSNNVNHTVATDSLGNWTVQVPGGSTTIDVQESDPQFPANAIHKEGLDPNTVTAIVNQDIDGGTDGYFIPAIVNGHLYLDSNGDGFQNAGEPNLANVDVRVTDSNNVTQTVVTNSSGNWTVQVPGGSTSINVDETDPQFTALVATGTLQHFIQTQGNDPTVINAITGTTNDGGTDGYYNPTVVYGHLFKDTNGNGTQEIGEPNLANVNVVVIDANNVTQTVVSDSTGTWSATVVPGIATINVDDTDPDFTALLPTGTYVQTSDLDPSFINVYNHLLTYAGNDGWFIPATVTGRLYLDINGNGTQDNGEPGLPNVDVVVTDSLGRNLTVYTNVSGDWTARIIGGSTTIKVNTSDPDFLAHVMSGTPQTEGADPTVINAQVGTSQSGGIDGWPLTGPFSISGQVRDDLDKDGNLSDTRDRAVPNVVVKLWLDFNYHATLTGGGDQYLLATTTTNALGAYSFSGLPNGRYIVEEINPAASLSTKDTQGGNDDEIAVFINGANSIANDFLDGVDPTGYAYDSVTGEIVAGGSIVVNGPGVVTVGLDGSNGQYSFITDGTPGDYTVTYSPPLGYIFDPARAVAGPAFDPTGGIDPTSLGSSENPSNPGFLTDASAPANPYYFTFQLAPGDPFVINNNFPLRLKVPKKYTYWKKVTPGGGPDPTSNGDGDCYSDIIEYALNLNPNSGVQTSPVFRGKHNTATNKVEVAYNRAAGGLSDIGYQLVGILDLNNSPAGWTPLTLVPVITPNGDGTETVTYPDVESDPFFAGQASGIVRLKVAYDANGDTVADLTASTPAFGWNRHTFGAECVMTGHPYLKGKVFCGNIDSLAGSVLNVATSAGAVSLVAQFTSGHQYFVEVYSGDNAGQRFEINEGASTATTIAIDTASPLNTLPSLPASLVGDKVVVREHWTLDELFNKNQFTVTNNPNTADRLLFYDASINGYRDYWLGNIASPQWTRGADAFQANSGGRIMPPCEGWYTHPKGGAQQVVWNGMVRANPCALSLINGLNFIGSAYPMDQSPNSRGITIANGFVGNRDPLKADQLLFWKGYDTNQAMAYYNHFLLSYGALQRWTEVGNAAFIDENNLPLFKPLTGSIYRMRHALPGVVMPMPWTP